MDNDIKLVGGLKSSRDDRQGSVLIPSAVIGIVKNNIDPNRAGKLDVYLKRGSTPDEDNPNYWTPVQYLSPFFGNTPNTGSPDSDGTYVGNSNSYGFWATPPDIGTEVLCLFLNGQQDSGYYIGCVPKPGLTHMVPAIGSSDTPILNDGEAASYGGATKLPVSEYNNANKKQDNSSTPSIQNRPVHSYQAAILNKQGLIRDPVRGTIGSSSQRESPSRVFGISTPGRPIYQGGYDDTSIGDAIKDDSIPNENFKVVGRRGGHTLVMDDGDVLGRDQLVRIRTASGHMIMMNDAAQALFITHANGQSFIELGKEGTVDIYSTNSVNIRTQGDLNLHADRNININAAKDLNISAENIKLESLKETTQSVGTNFKGHTKGDHTLKVDGKYALTSAGDLGIKSGGTVYVNGGPDVKLNSGEMSLVPEEVKQITVVAHTDTLYDDTKGYVPAPGKLASITSRAPAHMPWAHAGQGTDAKTDIKASSNLPAAPSPTVSAINKATPNAPAKTTNSSLASTVPNIPAVSNQLDKTTTSAMVSQMAVTAATGPLGPAVAAGAGIFTDAEGKTTPVIGSLGLNATQMVEAGILKPGSDVIVNAALQSGKSLEEAIPSNLFTGKNGIKTLNHYLNSQSAQAKSGADLLASSELGLKAKGIITGNESGTQTAGLVMSAAGLGLKPTLDYMKSITGSAGSLTDLEKLKSTVVNMAPGSVKDLISGGNFAAGLADKAMGALGGIKLGSIDVGAQLKGSASSLFASITGALKPLKIGPQNLTVIKAEADNVSAAANAITAAPTSLGIGSAITSAVSRLTGTATSAVTNIGDTINQSVSSLPSLDKLTDSVGGISGLPGGLSSVSNLASKLPTSIPGLANINAAVKGLSSISSAVSNLGSTVTGLQAKLTSGKDSLESLAATGLSAADASKLAGAINAMGSGGPVEVKLPTIATDSFDFGAIAAQSKKLLGDIKIPALSFGSAAAAPAPDAATAKKSDELREQLATEEEAYTEAQNAFTYARETYGADSAQATQASATYKSVAQKYEDLRSQIGKLSA